MKYCTNCGNALDDNAIACHYCGKEFTEEDLNVEENPKAPTPLILGIVGLSLPVLAVVSYRIIFLVNFLLNFISFGIWGLIGQFLNILPILCLVGGLVVSIIGLVLSVKEMEATGKNLSFILSLIGLILSLILLLLAVILAVIIPLSQVIITPIYTIISMMLPFM